MIDLDGRVAIVTGAGGGLGREHALLLARRGARVVVNDLGGTVNGVGGSASAAEKVAAEIRGFGGEAIANAASVTDYAEVEKMVAQAVAKWGRVDLLVNNAGILRDRTFSKMDLDDFRAVIDVHLMGAVHCTKAVWDGMKAQRFGRIVMTTSSSGLFGNFGQSNYAAAKLALVGFAKTLALEGAKYNVHVNSLAPTAGTRMLEGLMSDRMREALDPAKVAPGMLALVGAAAPNGVTLCAGAGSFEQSHITLTRGIYADDPATAAESISANWINIADRSGEIIPESGAVQGQVELEKAGLGTLLEQSA